MHSLQDVSKLTGLPVRTIRYYIQKGLVDKPDGARKTASYSQSHLEQLMTVKRLSDSGLSLAAIAKVMNGSQASMAQHSDLLPGQIRAVSQVHICSGVDRKLGGRFVIFLFFVLFLFDLHLQRLLSLALDQRPMAS